MLIPRNNIIKSPNNIYIHITVGDIIFIKFKSEKYIVYKYICDSSSKNKGKQENEKIRPG